MTSPPDKLFRQGLEHYQKPAPGSAWDRIESGLDKKKHKSPWFKIAATLLLLMVASFVIWQLNEADTAVATELQEIGSRRQEAVNSRQSSVDSSQLNSIVERSRNNQLDVVKKNLPVGERTRAERSRSSRNEPSRNSLQSTVYSSERSADPAKGTAFVAGPQSSVGSLQSAIGSSQSAVAIQKSVTSIESIQTETAEPDEKRIEPAALSKVEIATEISMTDNASDSKRTNITYTAEEVNAKYLKKEPTTEATPEKKNTSGLQKVIDLALDLKNEGSVLGDIREKKNEWLSFNIPSNKRETNK